MSLRVGKGRGFTTYVFPKEDRLVPLPLHHYLENSLPVSGRSPKFCLKACLRHNIYYSAV